MLEDAKVVLIYDGDCGLCERSLRIIERLDSRGVFVFYPFQDPRALENYKLDIKSCEQAIQLIEPGFIKWSGGDALIRVGFRLPLLAPISRFLWLQPFRGLVSLIYKLVAKNRKLLSSSCGLDPKG